MYAVKCLPSLTPHASQALTFSSTFPVPRGRTIYLSLTLAHTALIRTHSPRYIHCVSQRRSVKSLNLSLSSPRSTPIHLQAFSNYVKWLKLFGHYTCICDILQAMVCMHFILTISHQYGVILLTCHICLHIDSHIHFVSSCHDINYSKYYFRHKI